MGIWLPNFPCCEPRNGAEALQEEGVAHGQRGVPAPGAHGPGECHHLSRRCRSVSSIENDPVKRREEAEEGLKLRGGGFVCLFVWLVYVTLPNKTNTEAERCELPFPSCVCFVCFM